MRHTPLLLCLLASTAACESSSNDNASSNETLPSGSGGAAAQGALPSTGGPGPTPVETLPGAGGTSPAPTGGGEAGGVSATNGGTGGTDGTPGATASGGVDGTSTAGNTASGGDGPTTEGTSGSGGAAAGGTSSGGTAGSSAGTGGGNAGTGGSAIAGAGGETAVGGQGGSQSGGAGGSSVVMPTCIGDALPSADPTSAGPFQVAADKGVGPLAGVVPDPIYGDEQQRYNVYRPADLEQSGYCHPILIWANGYRDNPEQNPPDCIVDSGANRWCGQYLPMLEHLASHGFVVVASLSTATAEGDPLPTIAGLDWILEQAEDPSSPYYQHLDTSNIGQLGHSYGGMSTCMTASEPRYKALATICGTRALSGVHTPMMFFCGGNDTTVDCAGVRETFLSVTDQPAFFINELNADHGSWVYQGAGGVSLSSAAAWFRAHLMGDTESREFFYGANCRFCNDNRVEIEQNSLMSQP